MSRKDGKRVVEYLILTFWRRHSFSIRARVTMKARQGKGQITKGEVEEPQARGLEGLSKRPCKSLRLKTAELWQE